MCALASNPTPQVLDAILSSREKRDTVLRDLLGTWKLSPADQLRFVSRRISTDVANLVIDTAFSTAEAKALAAERSSPDRRARWLTTANLNDEQVLPHLILLSSPTWLFETLVPQLLLRPGLRSYALRSSCEELEIAACWNELVPADQTVAAEVACKRRLPALNGDPIIGLLTQPSLDLELRARLWDILVADDLHYGAVAQGVCPPGSPLYPGTPLADVIDPDVIDLLLDAYSVPPANQLARAAYASILHELSLNEHLSVNHSERLVVALCHHVDDRRSPTYPLERDLVRLALLIDPNASPTATLGRFGAATRVIVAINAGDRSLPPPPVSVLHHQRNKDTFAYPYRDLNQILDSGVDETDYLPLRIRILSPELTKQLGLGTTPLSVRSWIVFLGLLDSDPKVSVRTVLATAKRLAAIEHPVPAF